MRVLTVSTTYPRWADDARPRFVHDLARFLTDEGVETTVLAPHHPGARYHENLDGVDVYRHPYFLPTSLENLCFGGGIQENMRHSILAKAQLPLLCTTQLVSLIALALKKRPEIIHAHWILPQGLNAMITSLLLGIPFIVTVHGADAYSADSNLIRKISRWVLSKASSVTANSVKTRAEVEKQLGMAEITIIPMGVDESSFKPKNDRAPGKTILFIGRLAEIKGVEYLIRAFPKVKEKHPEAKLNIIGEGEEEPRLRREAESTGHGKDIHFLGPIPHEKITGHYQAADVFILPSIVDSRGASEGLGVVVIEALACGTPTVATELGGITDIIKDGETGLLVPEKNPDRLADAIDKILSDRDLADRLARNGRLLVHEKYGWEKIASEFKRVYIKATKP